jgi:hypothetical protein
MNDIIAKLYDQAIVIEDGGDYVCGELDPVKFAELIINACLGACIADIADPRDTVELKCAKKIKASWDDESWDKPEWVQLTFDDFPEAEFGNTEFLAGARWAARILRERNE